MKPGWTIIPHTNRWTSVWLTKQGFIGLNAFASGTWSITKKSEASEINPHGIIRSSFHDGPVGKNLLEAMELAEAAAKELGAAMLGHSDKVETE